jgi:hypothetical protein
MFADDCNLLTSLEPNNLNNIKNILDTFGSLSGLECNLQKSNVLTIGDDPALSVDLLNTGFNFVEKITVLGFTLVNNVTELCSINTTNIEKKVTDQIRFWSRINLSLPGRINICKSMLYSQLNYIGSVLPVSVETIERLENRIYEYACGNQRISKKRVFLPTTHGGLGLFDLKNFLEAQKCGWICKCKNTDQDWKVLLFNSGSGNMARISELKIDKNKNPIVFSIAESLRRFITEFTKKIIIFWRL